MMVNNPQPNNKGWKRSTRIKSKPITGMQSNGRETVTEEALVERCVASVQRIKSEKEASDAFSQANNQIGFFKKKKYQ